MVTYLAFTLVSKVYSPPFGTTLPAISPYNDEDITEVVQREREGSRCRLKSKGLVKEMGIDGALR